MPLAERVWARLRDDRAGLVGLAIVGVFLVVSLAVWLGIAGQGWSAADGGRWEPAGRQHWFGTNVLGQDIFQRAVYSVRTAFEIGHPPVDSDFQRVGTVLNISRR